MKRGQKWTLGVGIAGAVLGAALLAVAWWLPTDEEFAARLTAEAERKPDLAKAAWTEVVAAFDVLETALAKTAWLAGPAFSVADLNVAAALYRALALDLGKWPHLNAWLHRCWERPAAKRVRAVREGK